MTIYHIHHIVPKHSGGSNDPENLIKVTIPEHAAFHYERWVLIGNEYDRIAWLVLVGQIKNQTANKLAMSLGGKDPRCHTKQASEKSKQTHLERYGVTCIFNLPKNQQKRDESIFKKYGVRNPSQIPESKIKIGLKNSRHQKGEGNSQYGTIWITDGVTNKKILKNDPLPFGYRKGRIIRHQSLKKSSNAIALSSIQTS